MESATWGGFFMANSMPLRVALRCAKTMDQRSILAMATRPFFPGVRRRRSERVHGATNSPRRAKRVRRMRSKGLRVAGTFMGTFMGYWLPSLATPSAPAIDFYDGTRKQLGTTKTIARLLRRGWDSNRASSEAMVPAWATVGSNRAILQHVPARLPPLSWIHWGCSFPRIHVSSPTHSTWPVPTTHHRRDARTFRF